MVSILLEKQNILFAHVPRTGGGSISRALQDVPGARRLPVQNMDIAIPCIAQLERQLPEQIASLKIVAVVRNPWDWAVSGYLHVTRNMPAFEKPPAFRDFVRGAWRGATTNPYPDKFTNAEACVAYHTQITPWDHLFPNEQKGLSIHICRFESLLHDAREALPLEDLPHIHRTERTHYSRYYDDETMQIIMDRNSDLIEAFKYTFDAD